MLFNLRLIPAAAAALVLAACGGGSNPGPSPNLTPSKGVAVDGYLQFSKVVCDANDNGLFDTGETVVYTLADGSFSFPAGCTHGILVTGGKSADTQLDFVGLLKSPAGATVASPLTTLISAGMTQDQIIKALDLDLPSDTDLLKTDPAATTGGTLNNPELLKKTLAVQQLLQKVTELSISLSSVTGSVASEAVYANVASTFATMLKTSASLIKTDGTLDSDVVKTMVTTAVTNVAASSAVPTEVKTALSAAVTKAGGAANISAVAVVALAEQGNALLSATDTTITAVTLAKQGNTSIATSIKAAITQEKLTATTNTASITALAQETATAAITPVTPTNYLYLVNNALSYTDGASSPTTTNYSLSDFTGAGIDVVWPMPSTAAIKLNLAEMGTFTMAQGQTLKAAVHITQDTPAGSGEVRGYIDNILVTKTGKDITVTIPTLSKAMVYGVTADGNKSSIIDFKEAVVGISNTLTSAANSESTILLGDVVNFAVNGVSNDFTGMYSLTGKYKVTIVVTELPLRKANGDEFPKVTVKTPTQLDSNGKAVVATEIPVMGPAIVGYINLKNPSK